jgi:hypothetical protein
MIRVYESKTYLEDGSVVDLMGNSLSLDVIEEAFGVIAQNFGTPTHMLIPESVLKSLTRMVKKGNSLKSKHK